MGDDKLGSRPSLRSLFSSSSMANDLSQASQNSGNSEPHSHRFFLRSRSSRNSLSPQSTTSDQKHPEYPSKPPSFNSRNNSSTSVLSHRDEASQASQTTHASHSSESKLSESSDTSKKKSGFGHHHHSHLSLKRFLKKLKHTDSHEKRPHKSVLPHSLSSDLFKKYSKLGRLIGTGASGLVNLVSAKNDPEAIFAVKKFRAKLQNETDADYKTKVKNEFKIGQYLTHQNLIHTIELFKESPGKFLGDPEYYIVMEYCPYDFFNLVMLGLMGPDEVTCYFKQICNGVGHLHENGIAHRDLKLDNCVVNGQGILKLIDFGLALQFRKERLAQPVPEEDVIDSQYRLIRARGIVGSDPYLAPEVFEPSNFGYDPRTADVWSIAIIFCCMVLRRFPWKIPKLSDPSYRLFVGGSEESLDQKTQNLSLDTQSKPNTGGPHRLLRLLPEASRELIHQMLTVDPKQRLLIGAVLDHPYIHEIQHCYESDEGFVQPHLHHLVSEDELKKIELEKAKAKRLKETGVA